MNRLLMLLIAVPLAVASAFLVHAEEESYQQLASQLADYRGSVDSPLDGGDSLVFTTPLSTVGANRSLIPTKGNPTIYARVDFSVEGATSAIYCVGYVKTGASTYQQCGTAAVTTATGRSGQRAAGRYLHDGWLAFDTGTMTHVELRCTDPTLSATIAMLPWVGGSAPRGAGAD